MFKFCASFCFIGIALMATSLFGIANAYRIEPIAAEIMLYLLVISQLIIGIGAFGMAADLKKGN